MARRKNMFLYLGVALVGWWYYQKQKGNNIFGQPTVPAVTAATTAATNALIASGVANPTPAQVVQAASQIAQS